MLSTPVADNPLFVFLYAVKSPESKRQYPRRFKIFLDFLGFDGSLKEQAEEFLRNVKQDSEWVQNSLIQFISYQNDRAKRGETGQGSGCDIKTDPFGFV